VYDREYQNKKINFEASGGLMHSSLVMQDMETDTYWAIMTGEAIGGEMKGTRLRELPIGEKMRWKDWVKQHPNTLVLSVDGRQDVTHNPYDSYFSSPDGFRGQGAKDSRLKTKEPIFAFHYEGRSYAVPYSTFEGGKSFALGDAQLFLYRPRRSEIFHSTAAYLSRGGQFQQDGQHWLEARSGAAFDEMKAEFGASNDGGPERFHGFDTFWYNWSLSNPETKLLK
jgi:hypothetical protein